MVLASATPAIETAVAAGCVARRAGSPRPAGATWRCRRGTAGPPCRRCGWSTCAATGRRAAASCRRRCARRLAETLAAGAQSLLFLNRRGYAPLTLCRACGHRLACPNCSAWLVSHRLRGRLQCHHCGYAMPAPEHCPSCGSVGLLAASGPGVERLAEELAELLPTARRGGDDQRHHERCHGRRRASCGPWRATRVDVLIGTQIIAKGHHFPDLTLVGVVDADLGPGRRRSARRRAHLPAALPGRGPRRARGAAGPGADPDPPARASGDAGAGGRATRTGSSRSSSRSGGSARCRPSAASPP